MCNRISCELRRATALLLLGAATLGSTKLAQGVSLDDFGYRHVADHGLATTLGQRPLLVILVEFDTVPKTELGHPLAYYDALIFNRFGQGAVNGFFVENSNDRFYWSRAGITNITLSAGETAANFPNVPGSSLSLFYSNVIAQTMIQRRFDFSAYTNSDAFVTPDELQILIVRADAALDGNVRGFGDVKPEGFDYTVQGYAVQVGHLTGVSTICHELGHTLQQGWGDHNHGWELYGVFQEECLSDRLTIMSCTGANSFWHFDPWHKMQFGWCDPRIRSLRTGGIESISAPQFKNPSAPLILYDPERGTNEFFMVEYRTPTVSNRSLYDAYVAGNGVVIWHVQQGEEHHPISVPRVDAGPIPGQNLWRSCEKCQGVHYIANADAPVLGPCPEGGQHSDQNSRGYLVVNENASAPGQHGWRWCRKCQGLFWGADAALSHCPASGTHDGSESGDYSLMQGLNHPGQLNWRWCHKCAVLFFGPRTSDSACPADGAMHDGSLSSAYAMLLEGRNATVWAEGPPSFKRGTSTVWGSGAITGFLRRFDGSETRTRIYVRPFNPGSDGVTIEWWAEEDTWVQFDHGGAERGTFVEPFNTLSEGVNAASHGGIVKIKSGTTPETLPINRRLKLEAFGGPVTIGESSP